MNCSLISVLKYLHIFFVVIFHGGRAPKRLEVALNITMVL